MRLLSISRGGMKFCRQLSTFVNDKLFFVFLEIPLIWVFDVGNLFHNLVLVDIDTLDGIY